MTVAEMLKSVGRRAAADAKAVPCPGTLVYTDRDPAPQGPADRIATYAAEHGVSWDQATEATKGGTLTPDQEYLALHKAIGQQAAERDQADRPTRDEVDAAVKLATQRSCSYDAALAKVRAGERPTGYEQYAAGPEHVEAVGRAASPAVNVARLLAMPSDELGKMDPEEILKALEAEGIRFRDHERVGYVVRLGTADGRQRYQLVLEARQVGK